MDKKRGYSVNAVAYSSLRNYLDYKEIFEVKSTPKPRNVKGPEQTKRFQSGRYPYNKEHPNTRGSKNQAGREVATSSKEHQADLRRRVINPQPHQPGGKFSLKTQLLKMIVTDLQTPSLVEEDGFHHFVKALNPSTDAALSASTIRQELVNMYDITKRKVKNAVINANNPVLSAEQWISSNEESYLTVTCHFIDKKWELKSYTLQTTQLLGEHSPENVHQQLWRISTEWELMEKIQVVVINFDGMKKAKLKSNWTYIPCFSHTLNKVVQEVMQSPDWTNLLKKCNDIVQFFHQDDKASWCHQLGQHSAVDWVSALNMLKKISEQWPSFSKVPSYKHALNLWLNENDRKLLDDVVEVLTLVKDITGKLGTKGYVSVSNIIPLLDEFQSSLQGLIQQEKKVALNLAEKWQHHFGNINQNHWFTISTTLDPRFKSSVLMTDRAENVKEKIKEEMCKQASGTPSHDNRKGLGKMNYENVFLQYARDISATPSSHQYWASKNNPVHLAMVAHKYLSVISTAIPIERIKHQHKSNTIFNRRKCLEPKDINIMLFLNGNQQYCEF